MRALLFLFLINVFLYADNCDEKLFSLQAYKHRTKAVTIESVLREISQTCNVSILFGDDKSRQAIKKKLDFINIKDYTFRDFLDFLSNEGNLFYKYNSAKNSIKFSYYKTKTYSIDYIDVSKLTTTSSKSINSSSSSSSSDTTDSGTSSSTNGSDSGNSSTSSDITEVITESTFTFWEHLQENINKLLKDSKDTKIILNQNASMLTVTASKKELDKITNYLDDVMHKMHKQVMIEAKIIELVYNDSSNAGLDWSKLNMSLQGSMGNINVVNGVGSYSKPGYELTYSLSVNDFINFLDSYGNVKILSNPKILTLNNQPAVINVGQELSYKYQTGSVVTTGGTAAGTNTYALGSTFVGITLYVIPEVNENDDIIMKINPVISSLADSSVDTTAPITRELPPDIKIKQLTSIVRVKNNQKIIIGGLISTVKSKTNKDTPLLGSIPIIGSLFFKQSQDLVSKSEMFIVLIPKVIKISEMPSLDDVKYDEMFDINTTKR
jgi:general secretion pathway protein D